MIFRFIVIFFLSGTVVSAMTYVLRTLEQRWSDVDIIAIVNVGKVHTVTTPEGITLQSAEATVEREIFRRVAPFDQTKKTKIRIFSLMPNGLDQEGLPLASGRTFVMMKQRGVDAFFPADPWEFQSLSANEIFWPTTHGIQQKSIAEVTKEIEQHIEMLKND